MEEFPLKVSMQRPQKSSKRDSPRGQSWGSLTLLLSAGSGHERSPGKHGSRQVNSTTTCTCPASKLSAMQWWELNVPIQQACGSAAALPAQAGIHPETLQPWAPCGNAALETALPCASFCAADTWNHSASLEKWRFSPFPSLPLFIGTKE